MTDFTDKKLSAAERLEREAAELLKKAAEKKAAAKEKRREEARAIADSKRRALAELKHQIGGWILAEAAKGDSTAGRYANSFRHNFIAELAQVRDDAKRARLMDAMNEYWVKTPAATAPAQASQANTQ